VHIAAQVDRNVSKLSEQKLTRKEYVCTIKYEPEQRSNQCILKPITLFTQYGTHVKQSVEMDDQLIARIKADEMKPRKHPGIMKVKTAEVPVTVVSAMEVVIKGK
jgi:hypothetical protein